MVKLSVSTAGSQIPSNDYDRFSFFGKPVFILKKQIKYLKVKEGQCIIKI
ncbi:hypothetical protein GCM10007275_12320 [Jeotgalicoccus coquinae]|nr:hypothetical protein GCM10007275_12320 [Jeotgalicoccus coquinae]